MARTKKTPATLMAAIRYFDPETASQYVKGIKWPECTACPKCGSVNVGFIKSRNRHQCREKECRRQFSLTTGTIFEGTHLGLDQWMVAVWMIVNCRNGVSSCEIARTIGCKQQSAWHLLHRVREVMRSETHYDLLDGTVEADTTFVGGIFKNMPHERRKRTAADFGGKGKVAVHAVLQRGGDVRASVIRRENRESVRPEVRRHVAPGSRLHTDAGPAYRWASENYKHEWVNHGANEYVRGDVTTNGCENYFNCLRRALKGTYIRPTPNHLQAYVDEATFRFNIRNESEWVRFDTAMRMIVGKRLTYKKLTGGAKR